MQRTKEQEIRDKRLLNHHRSPIILAGTITETARRQAEANASAAEAERERVAQQSLELAEANQRQEAQLNEQRALIELVATLETPAITLADGVLFAPIVGQIDSRRAQALTTRLLEAAHTQRAKLVILDISGVSAVDTLVARALLNTARALRLLGCRVTISGISAAVAATLTSQNVALEDVTTVRSPQEALEQRLGGVSRQLNGVSH